MLKPEALLTPGESKCIAVTDCMMLSCLLLVIITGNSFYSTCKQNCQATVASNFFFFLFPFCSASQ